MNYATKPRREINECFRAALYAASEHIYTAAFRKKILARKDWESRVWLDLLDMERIGR